MLETNGDTVRKVAWAELFPWLALVRTFRVAISLRVLVLGALGLLLTLFGWALLGKVFSGNEQAAGYSKQILVESPWTKTGGWTPSQFSVKTAVEAPTDPVLGVWLHLGRPVWLIFRDGSKLNVASLACLMLSALWAMAVWALLGGAISRMAAVQLAADERIGWGAALRFAASKWPSYFAAPLLPLLGVVLVAAPLWMLGLLLRIDPGLVLGGLLWPLALLAGLVMALLLLGLGFGWPLMWATISTEGTDSFDALSRSYAYLFQRPLRYFFYVLVAVVLGGIGWLLVRNFADAVIALSYWAAGWGSGSGRIGDIQAVAPDLKGMAYFGSRMIHLWDSCVRCLAVGFFYGYFWTAASAIYLLLRRDVDATETDEVFLDADKNEPEHSLPPSGADQEGAPPTADSAEEANGDTV
jgi:hypothetical protein